MFAKTLFKNPIFTLGIFLMGIFIYQLSNGGKFPLFNREELTPTSCSAVKANLRKRIPSSWEATCDKGVLIMNIQLTTERDLSEKELRELIVREMANDLFLIARYSPEENLERTPSVVVKLNHAKIGMNARTEGKTLVRLATLTDKKLIAEHLKATVDTQIITK